MNDLPIIAARRAGTSHYIDNAHSHQNRNHPLSRRLTLVGIALGIGGALAVSRLMQRALFEVDPADPFVYLVPEHDCPHGGLNDCVSSVRVRQQ